MTHAIYLKKILHTIMLYLLGVGALITFGSMKYSYADPNVIRLPGGSPIKRPIIKPVTRTVIRGIPYNDHSANTSLWPSTAPPGGWISIQSNSWFFERTVTAPGYRMKVVIQDVNAPPNSSGGVTVFELRNWFARGTVIQAQLPMLGLFHHRSFHVTVFAWGPQGNMYTYAGVVKIQP